MRTCDPRLAAALLALAGAWSAAPVRAVPLALEVVGIAEQVSEGFDEINPYVPPLHVAAGDRLAIALQFDGADLVVSACSTMPEASLCYTTNDWRLEIVFPNRAVVEDLGILELQLFTGTATFALSTLLAEPFVVVLEEESGTPTGPSTDPEALLLSPSVRATRWGFFPGGASVSGGIDAVPEPAAGLLTLVGGAVLAGCRRTHAYQMDTFTRRGGMLVDLANRPVRGARS